MTPTEKALRQALDEVTAGLKAISLMASIGGEHQCIPLKAVADKFLKSAALSQELTAEPEMNYKALLKELWEWKNSPEVEGWFAMAHVHGSRVKPEFAEKVEDMNRRIEAALSAPPAPTTGEGKGFHDCNQCGWKNCQHAFETSESEPVPTEKEPQQ